MTQQEHLLVLTMLTKQMQSTKVLVDVLKSRGLLEGDDAAAFQSAVAHDLDSNAALFQDALKEYLGFAKHLRIETGLEGLVRD